MPKRANKWILSETKDGQWDLQKGGRFLYQGLSSKNEALKRMKIYYKPGDPVLLEEPDGYRTNITNQLRNSGVI